jgi:formyltetrahydrofolate-dependent phosphoribosylglycinamide formyltransferase
VSAARVAVLASGGGTNLQALLDAAGALADASYRVTRVVSNRRDAGALDRGRRAGCTAVVLRNVLDAAELQAALGDSDLVVLAGYLKLVPAAVVARFRWRMINIHPALLPSFGGDGMYGLRVHAAVLASGATVTGATVHYVDEAYDRGPVIAQWPVPVRPGDTPDALAGRVLAVEHRLLPAVVAELARRGFPPGVRLHLGGQGFTSGDTPSLDLR